jgi:hypothetical protein
MWLKGKRTNALLQPLSAVIAGEVAGGGVTGVYEGYGVEARPRTDFPLEHPPTGKAYRQAGDVDMLRVILTGVGGKARWVCQSSPGSLLQDAVSRMTSGRMLRSFRPGEFSFEGVDRQRESLERLGAGLTKALGAPVQMTPDPELQERLIGAGLFEQLSALRWGPHPFLPKAEFTPPGREMAHRFMESPAFARMEPKVSERVRVAGLPDYETLMKQRMAEVDASAPGRLLLAVEVGKARVPTPERFRELLDAAVRIAEINLRANPPTGSS